MSGIHYEWCETTSVRLAHTDRSDVGARGGQLRPEVLQMARQYKVHMLKNGTPKDVYVVAQNQKEAGQLAEAQNPGWKASHATDQGPAK